MVAGGRLCLGWVRRTLAAPSHTSQGRQTGRVPYNELGVGRRKRLITFLREPEALRGWATTLLPLDFLSRGLKTLESLTGCNYRVQFLRTGCGVYIMCIRSRGCLRYQSGYAYTEKNMRVTVAKTTTSVDAKKVMVLATATHISVCTQRECESHVSPKRALHYLTFRRWSF